MIVNPWLIWSLNVRTARMALETLDASAKVIGRRSGILSAAARNPLTADYAEIGRMVSEKVSAFSAAGRTAAGDCSTLQHLWLKELSGLGVAPSWNVVDGMGEAARAASRSAKLVERAGGTMLRAMTPIHSTATANAKRLKRKKRR